MKKGIRRLIGVGGLGLASLLGCNSGKAVVNPSNFNRIETVESVRNELKGRSLNARRLEETLSDENINSLFKAGKTIVAEPEIVDYNSKVGDFNYDHNINFNDFFLFADNFGSTNTDYDLDNSGKVDFSDFFRFADGFGKNVNRRPMLSNVTADRDTVEVNEDVNLSAIADDKENDSLIFNWRVNGTEATDKTQTVRRSFDLAGEYNFDVKARDSYNAESLEDTSKKIVVVDTRPRLSLPSEIRFSQYENNGRDGNIYTLNLDSFVADPKFRDDELTWSFDVENNYFEKFLGYKANKLHLNLDGNRNLSINPVAEFNASDYGDAYVNLSVSNPNGKNTNKRVKVTVEREEEFDSLYDRVVRFNEGWNDASPTTAYIWRGKSRAEFDSRDPRQWKGPVINQAQEEDILWLVNEEVPRISDWNLNVEYLYDEDWNRIYDAGTGKFEAPDLGVLFVLDGNEIIAGAPSQPTPNYRSSRIHINPKPNRPLVPVDDGGLNRDVLLHELSHVYGFYHPTNENIKDMHYIFSQWFCDDEVGYIHGSTPPLSEAIIRSRYEANKYK